MNDLLKTLRLVRQCDKGAFWRRIVYVVLQSIIPLLNIYILKLLIDRVTMGAGDASAAPSFLPLLALMALLYFSNMVLGCLYGVNSETIAQRSIDHTADVVQQQAVRLDMAYYDNPAYHDTFHRAQQEASYRPIQVFNSCMSLLGSVVAIAGVGVMLLTSTWWIVVVMIAAVVPSFLIRLHKARSIYAFRKSNTQLYRQTGYYGTVLSARDYAKEIRAYGLMPFFRTRFVRSRKQLVSKILSISKRIGMWEIACALIEAVAMVVVVWMLVRQTYSSAITVGTFVMLFEAFRRGQGYLMSLATSVASLYDNRLFIGNLFEFLNLQPSIVDCDLPVEMPTSVETVEFRNVTFRYPDMDHNVLEHYSLVAERGTVTTIEGQNGAGKSTLVKLLLRLYDPDDGEILINGIDIRTIALSSLRAGVCTLFQDFVRYNCTLRENLTFAAPQSSSPQSATAPLGTADADRMVDFVGQLPRGYDTMLGRMFDGGAELSMGQWQRIAIARVLRSDSPIIVLDEPMAWLDAQARAQLHQIIDQQKQNKIIIMINHI